MTVVRNDQCTRFFGATYPKNEMMARAIQHTIPTYGIADIALLSPDMNIKPAQSGLARVAGVTMAAAYRWKY